MPKTHYQFSQSVCGVCFHASSRVRKITEVVLSQIKSQVYSDYSLLDNSLPNVICDKCRVKLSKEKHSDSPSTIDHFDHEKRVRPLLATRSNKEPECSCSICISGRRSGCFASDQSNPKIKKKTKTTNGSKIAPNRCGVCLSEIARGKSHKCNAESRRKNAESIVRNSSAKTRGRAAVVAIKEVKKLGNGDIVSLPTRGKPLKISLTANRKQKEFTVESMLKLKTSKNFSSNEILSFAAATRVQFGRSSVESNLKRGIVVANHKLDDFFDVVKLPLKMKPKKKEKNKNTPESSGEDEADEEIEMKVDHNGHVNIIRPVVYCKDIPGLVSKIIDERELPLSQVGVKFMADDGQGIFKVCLQITENTENKIDCERDETKDSASEPQAEESVVLTEDGNTSSEEMDQNQAQLQLVSPASKICPIVIDHKTDSESTEIKIASSSQDKLQTECLTSTVDDLISRVNVILSRAGGHVAASKPSSSQELSEKSTASLQTKTLASLDDRASILSSMENMCPSEDSSVLVLSPRTSAMSSEAFLTSSSLDHSPGFSAAASETSILSKHRLLTLSSEVSPKPSAMSKKTSTTSSSLDSSPAPSLVGSLSSSSSSLYSRLGLSAKRSEFSLAPSPLTPSPGLLASSSKASSDSSWLDPLPGSSTMSSISSVVPLPGPSATSLEASPVSRTLDSTRKLTVLPSQEVNRATYLLYRLEKLKVSELKQELKNMTLKVSGPKPVLIERLQVALEDIVIAGGQDLHQDLSMPMDSSSELVNFKQVDLTNVNPLSESHLLSKSECISIYKTTPALYDNPSRGLGTPPAVPVTLPAVPGTQLAIPGTPSAVPGTPSAVPGTPPAVPGTPPAVPGTPPAGPGTPPAGPGTPLAVPGTPLVVPGTPLAVPGTPLAVPGTPLAVPGTLQAVPGTLPAAPGIPPALTGTLQAVPGTLPATPGIPPALAGTPPAVPGTPPVVHGTLPSGPGTTPAIPGTLTAVPDTLTAVPGTLTTIPGTSTAMPVTPTTILVTAPTVPVTPPAVPVTVSAVPGTPTAAPVTPTVAPVTPTAIIVSNILGNISNQPSTCHITSPSERRSDDSHEWPNTCTLDNTLHEHSLGPNNNLDFHSEVDKAYCENIDPLTENIYSKSDSGSDNSDGDSDVSDTDWDDFDEDSEDFSDSDYEELPKLVPPSKKNLKRKKRSSYSQGVAAKKHRMGGVKKLFLIAAAPKIQELYENIDIIFELLGISPDNLCGEVGFSGDIKIVLSLLGKDSGSCRHSCPFCEGCSPWTEDANLNTIGSLKEWHQKWVKAGMKTKLSKNFQNMRKEPVFSWTDDTVILDMVNPPELHLLLGVVDKLLSELENKVLPARWISKFLSKNNISKSQKRGGKLQGNGCYKLLKRLDRLQSALDQESPEIQAKGTMFVEALRAFERVVHLGFGATVRDGFEDAVNNFSQKYRALNISVTPKVHIVERHLTQFFKRKNNKKGLGYYSEQSAESVHADFKQVWNPVKVPVDHPEFPSRFRNAVSRYNSSHI